MNKPEFKNWTIQTWVKIGLRMDMEPGPQIWKKDTRFRQNTVFTRILWGEVCENVAGDFCVNQCVQVCSARWTIGWIVSPIVDTIFCSGFVSCFRSKVQILLSVFNPIVSISIQSNFWIWIVCSWVYIIVCIYYYFMYYYYIMYLNYTYVMYYVMYFLLYHIMHY